MKNRIRELREEKGILTRTLSNGRRIKGAINAIETEKFEPSMALLLMIFQKCLTVLSKYFIRGSQENQEADSSRGIQ